MSITATDIKFYLTGGAANADPNASLGGAISSTEITSGNLHNLFDKVTGDESNAGDIEYRCLGVKNTHATLTLEASKVNLLTSIDAAFSYNGLSTVYTDEKADCNNATANDVVLPPIAQLNDAIYFGFPYTFGGVKVDIGTAGSYTATLVWEYWNGSAWTTLTVTDGSTGFTKSGKYEITWTPPGDWATTAVNSVTKYWVRCRVSAFTSVATAPLLTQAWTLSNKTVSGVVFTIGTETPSTGAVQNVANESTAPSAVSFSGPTTRASGITCTGEGETSGNVGPADWVGIWLKRDVTAGTGAYNSDVISISTSGDTAA